MIAGSSSGGASSFGIGSSWSAAEGMAAANPHQAARSEVLRRRRRGLRVAPLGCVGAVAPPQRPIEGLDAELVELVHLAHPARSYPISVIVRGLADLGQ